MQEQAAQLRTYSTHIRQMHNIVLQNNLVELGTGIPAIDNVAYGQTIDEERDSKEATDDPRIPNALKDLAAKSPDYDIEPEGPDIIGDFLARLGTRKE